MLVPFFGAFLMGQLDPDTIVNWSRELDAAWR
jgi:hypothetical protein